MELLMFVLMTVIPVISDGLTVHGPPGPLVAPLGSSVVLPCYVDEHLSVEGLEVEWRRTDSDILVHLYQDGESQTEAQEQDYQDRAHFFTDQIQHGNFSLRLDNLRAEDEGQYTCTVHSQDSGETVVEIKVDNVERLLVSGSSRSISASVGEDVTLSCSIDSHIITEDLEVSWMKTDEDGDIVVLLYQDHKALPETSDERYTDRVEFFTDETPKGNFSLRLKSVRTEDKGVYMCEVFAGGLSANTTVVLERLGFSALHIMVLILCVSASGSALLLCCLIYCRSPTKGLIVENSCNLFFPPGASVVLPCHVPPNLLTEDLKVEWRRTTKKSETLVHLYEDGEIQAEKQHQDYKERAHFFTEHLKHGNVSLRLDKLRAEDEGQYTCTVHSKRNCVFSAKTKLALKLPKRRCPHTELPKWRCPLARLPRWWSQFTFLLRRRCPLTFLLRRRCPLTFLPRRRCPLTGLPKRRCPLTGLPKRRCPLTGLPKRRCPLTMLPRRRCPLTVLPRWRSPLMFLLRRRCLLTFLLRRRCPLTFLPRRRCPLTLLPRRRCPLMVFPRRRGPLTMLPRRRCPLTGHPRRRCPLTGLPRRRCPLTGLPRRRCPLTGLPKRRCPLTGLPRRRCPLTLLPRRRCPLTMLPRRRCPLTLLPRRRCPLTMLPRRRCPLRFLPWRRCPLTGLPNRRCPLTGLPRRRCSLTGLPKRRCPLMVLPRRPRLGLLLCRHHPGALVYLCIQGLCCYTCLAHHPSPDPPLAHLPPRHFFFLCFSGGASGICSLKGGYVTGWLVCLGGPPDVTVYLFEHMASCLLLVPCALLSIV